MDIVTKETFKTKVQKLVEHFSDNESYYKSSKYKEDELRQEFINPFFKALGWDMDNEQGFAPQYREVIHEDRIEIEGKPKAPDYAFKVGSDRKFFVEAKASSVKVFSEIDPAFQLRRYAWSGQLSVSILTDFEEFSIYDTTIEPKHTDKSSVARVKYIHYKDYIKEADYLWDTFSKEAVWKGSFDKFAKREKKGSQLVDKSFLKEIELWRDLVAKDIASNNKLNIYELNFVVQKFIDRIIFLRIAEDRGVETYETLRSAIKSPNTYSQLLKIFSRADEKYNSSLFDLKKDELSAKIKISDKTLDKILNNLYYPKSPYEFSVIGVDILGSVYEQFLGKVIRLTKGGNAVIEEKPEVKKAGGVYYTPQYIVDYIVKNTVGELVEGKTPKDVAKLKIVDPACGSGSFLIGAYNYLLNWHHKYYVENDVEKNLKAKKLFKDAEGNFFLSTQEKKDILLNNIHGVDIDPQAVEVTKLSLALKMLEGENSETIGAQFVMFADRILPDLSSNIKCGNSLIGSDYYSDKQITLLGDEELRKVNAFDWEKEFPLVFRYGGFDAVIGNPPYLEFKQLEKIFKESIERSYTTATGKYDIYSVFIEKGLNIAKDGGLVSYITPSTFIKRDFGEKIREYIFMNSNVRDLVYFQDFQIFGGVTVFPVVFKLQRGKSVEMPVFIRYFAHNKELNHDLVTKSLNQESANEYMDIYKVEIKDFYRTGGWNIENPRKIRLKEKLEKDSTKVLNFVDYIFQGIASGKDEVFYVNEETIKNYNLERELLYKLIKGKDIKRYKNNWSGNYVVYPYDKYTNKVIKEQELKDKYPNIWKYFSLNKYKLSGREYFNNSSKIWYELWNERVISKFLNSKILVSEIAPETRFYLDRDGYFFNTKIFGIKPKELYMDYEYTFLALFNSNLIDFYHKQISVPKAGGFYEYKTQFIGEYPIKEKIFSFNEELKTLTKEIILLEEGKDALKSDPNRLSIVNSKIETLLREINGIVYEAYDLDPKDIALLEEKDS